jgi:hypothetical protein
VALIPKPIQKHWMHFVIWTAMLLYVVAARPLYTHYLLKDGKPVSFDKELPQQMTKRITYAIDRVDPIVVHGQNLYEIWGWSFLKGETNQSVYERLIVLQSDSQTYFFTTTNKARPDVQTAYADLQLDLNNSGFSAHISKDVLKRGTYQIGILLKNRDNGTVYYLVTHKSITRTANRLQLLPR